MRWLVAAVVLAFVGCKDEGEPVIPSEDAGTASVDWVDEVFGDDEPVTGCGDRVLDPGESCDDGNTVDGDGCSATCTWEQLCRDGVREGGEACDDGNTRDGDGCRSDCSQERCGDGILDLVAGEVCEGPECPTCGPPPSCGDGVLDEGETCDDGNLRPNDGCSPACRRDQVFMLNEFAYSIDSADGCDFIGSGVPTNQIGRSLRTFAPVLNEELRLDLGEGPEAVAMTFPGWERGAPPPSRFVLGFGLASVDRERREILRFLNAPLRVHATARGTTIETVPAKVLVSLPGFINPPGADVGDVRFELVVLPSTSSPDRLEGKVCGALPVSYFATNRDTFSGGAGQPPCAEIDRQVSFADAFVGGRSAGIVPVQPDVDLDGDGLERLIVEGTRTGACAPVIVGCVEGDGTVIDDPSCVFDVADGFSFVMTYRAEPAVFPGESAVEE